MAFMLSFLLIGMIFLSFSTEMQQCDRDPALQKVSNHVCFRLHSEPRVVREPSHSNAIAPIMVCVAYNPLQEDYNGLV